MRVFSNTAMSLDGKIGTRNYTHVALGSPEDRRRMSALRARADAVLVGGRTFRCWPRPMVEDRRHAPEAPRRERPVINAVLTRSGVTEVPADPWRDAPTELLVLGPPDLSPAHETRLGAELIGHPAPSVPWALDVLAARGCRSVLLEGGGDLLFQALEADRLDALFVTLCPLLVGGARSPTPMDGRGLDDDQLRRLDLESCERVGDELFLEYRVRRG